MPTYDRCELCEQEITDDEPRAPVWPLVAHIECLLRESQGGIGHHMDHAYWCIERHDPDAGLSYRQSALRVWALFQHAPD